MKIDLSSIMEMIAEQDGETIENKNPPVVENKLEIDQLFKLFEEAEPLLKEEGPIRTSVPTKALDTEESPKRKPAKKEEVLNLIIPTVVFRERDIAVGEEFVTNVSSRLEGKKVIERLRSLANLSTETGSPVRAEPRTKNFIYLLNKIAFIEGLTAIFSGFEATTAGLVNEQVMASLFPNGKRMDTTESNVENSVIDFVVGGKYYTLKTPKDGSSASTSSAYNYVKTLSEKRVITHVECAKLTEGESKKEVEGKRKKEVFVGFKVDEFYVSKDEEGTLDRIIIKKSTKKENELYLYYDGALYSDATPTLKMLLNLYQNRKNKNSPHFVSSINDATTESSERLRADFLNQRPEKLIENYIRQFSVSYKPGQGQVIMFNTSLSQMKDQLAEVVEEVFDDIRTLFESLATLSGGMRKYFTARNESTKIKIRNELKNAAEQVQPSTEKITTKIKE